MQITYIGHSTVLIELDGVRLLTDPVLSAHILHLRRRTPVPSLVNRGDISAILISHTHLDHFDLPTLERLGKATPVILPRGEGVRLRKRGFENVLEMCPGEAIQVGGLTLKATHADHGHRRFGWLRQRNCLGYLVSGHQTVYFPGDTDLFPDMEHIAENLYLALLPVWGWGPTLGPGHMDPYRAAQALQLLKPEIAIPIHWGTFSPLGFHPSRSRFLSDPPDNFARIAAEIAPAVRVQILAPGETFVFNPECS